MAQTKISQLPAATPLDGSEVVPILQGGTNKKTTAQDIADLGNGGGPTPDFDTVLAAGSTLTADREILIELNVYRETAFGPTDYSQRTIDNGHVEMIHSTNDNTQQCAISVEDDILITDTRNGRGLQGQQNFSSNIQANDFTQKNYVDALVLSAVAGLMDYRGVFDASVNAYPSSGGSGSAGAILKSDFWIVSVAGTLPTGIVVNAGDLVIAKQDTPGNTQANWSTVEYNIGFTPVNKAGDTMGGNLAMGGNKVTGLAAATTNGDAVRYEQVTPAVQAAIDATATSTVARLFMYNNFI